MALTPEAVYAQALERQRRYDHAKRAADPEGERAKVRARYARNPGPALERGWAMRAAKYGDPINDLTYAQFQEVLSSQDYRCAYCPDDCIMCDQRLHSLHAEHITPCVKGGPNTLHNVVAVCKQCNFDKHQHQAPRFVQPLLLTIAPAKPHNERPSHD